MNKEYEKYLFLYESYKNQMNGHNLKIEQIANKLDLISPDEDSHIVCMKKFSSENFYTETFIFSEQKKFVIFSIRYNEIVAECGEIREKLLNWLNKYYNNEIYQEKLDQKIEIIINNKTELLDNTFYVLFMYLLRKNFEPSTEEIIAFGKKEEWVGSTIEAKKEHSRLTVNCYKIASEMGSSEADFLLAKKYSIEYFNRELALSYYEKAAERKNVNALIEMAKYYKSHNNEEKFLKYINSAIELDSEDAKILLKEFNNQKECDLIAKNILDDIVKKTEKKCYEIHLKEEIPNILDSKIGGNPYIPINEKYPISKDGLPMALLIQINFDGVKLDNYPSKGIFQVFSNQDFYKNEFIVKYYKNIESNYQKEFPIINLKEFITNETLKIELKKASTFMPMSDVNFNSIFKEITKNYKRKAGVKESLSSIVYPYQALLGGYADFTQEDVRKTKKYVNYTECLIKIDDGISKKIRIGDSGIINILIKPEDLINNKLENSVVVWDCM